MWFRKKSSADSDSDSFSSAIAEWLLASNFKKAPRESSAIGGPSRPSLRAGHIGAMSARTGVDAYIVFAMRWCARARWSS